jgi:hypothetical protein
VDEGPSLLRAVLHPGTVGFFILQPDRAHQPVRAV